jgi:hypothetical protein
MKKNIIKIAIVVFLSIAGKQANAQYVTKGIKLFDLGIQPPKYGTLFAANARFGVADNIAVGPQLEYYSSALSSSWGLFARGEYHFGQALNLPENASVYVGATLGKVLKTGTEILGTGLIGGSYLFNDKIGAHAGVRFGLINASGYNSSFGTFNFGVSFRIAE